MLIFIFCDTPHNACAKIIIIQRFCQSVCLQKIIDEYRARGHDFLFQVFESSKCLEDLSGISDMINAQHEEVFIYLFM